MTKSLKASLRKGLVSIVMMTTIFSLSGIAAVIPVAQAATYVTGDLIRDPSPAGMEQFDVYVVKVEGTKMFKRLVLNPAIFESYGGLFKWEDVKLISSTEMNLFKTSGMIRIETAPEVFAVAPLAGSDVGSKSWLNVSGDTFAAAGGDWDAIYTVNAIDGAGYAAATELTTQAQVVTYLTAGTLPVPGGLSVALSAATPASSTLIANQANAHMADFTLTGTGTVTGVTLKRIGVSQDSTLSNVYLFDGATRLTDAAAVSSGSVNFTSSTGLFTVSGTKTISVKAELGGTAGETVGLQLTAVTLSSGVVSGTLPISGNIHSIASATVATVTVGAPLPSSAATTDPVNDVRVWESTFTVATRDVLLSRLALRQINSIESKDISNFRLLIDGTQVASVAALDANGYVTFSGFSNLLKSGSRTIKVLADVLGGSSRIIQLSLRNKADINVADSQYGVDIAVAGTIPASTSTLTVNSGTLSVTKAVDSPSGNVTIGASNTVLGKYTFTAQGEAIKVETLTPGFTYTNAGYTAPVIAARTLTVATAPLATETVTIGACVITFVAATGTDDVACADNAASIYVQKAGPTNRSTAEISTVISTLTGVTDAVQGALVVSVGSTTTTVFTAPAALTGSITYTDGTNGKITGAVTTAGVTQVGTANAAATLRNGMILVNGSQVGSTTTLAPAGTAFTTNFIVTPGTPATVEITADVFDNDGTGVINASDTILATMLIGSSNGSRQVSLGTINVPTATTAASQVTVASGAMTLASLASYPAQTTVVPQTTYKLGSWTLAGSSTEAINLNTLSLDVDEVTNATFSEADITDMYLVYGGNTSTTKATASAADNDWSITYTLAKNASITIELFANIGSTITAGDSVKTDLTATGTGADSGAAITQADVDGQTITYQAGSVTATRDAGTPVAAILDDAGTVKTASFKFSAVYDKYTISEMVVAVSNATAVTNVIIKDGTTVIGTKPGATAVTFSGISVPVENNKDKVIDVYVELAAVGAFAGTSGSAVTTDYTSAKASPLSTGVEVTVTDSTVTGNAMYVYKATPIVTQVALPTATLGSGTKTIAKFKVESTGGSIAWKQVLIDVTKTGGGTANGTDRPTIASVTLWDVTSTPTQVTAATVIQNASGATATTCVADDTTCEILISVGTDTDDNVEEQVSGAKTYEVRATIGGTFAVAGYHINTSIAQDLTYVAPAIFTTAENDNSANNAAFVWSDLSATSHDTGTADWNNDYLVNSLPFATQGLVY